MPLPSPPTRPTIAILGAGFGGLFTARRLDALLRRSRNPIANVILIDRHNYFLVTPLLFEAGSGVLEPRHSVSPVRKLLKSVRFVQARVSAVDLDRRIVRTHRLPLQKDRKGRVLTDATMRSISRPEVWAVGNCAHVPAADGTAYPQLAQHAMREGKALASNLLATLRNEPTTPFIYDTKGTLAALGHRTGVGTIGRLKIRGFPAWWIWRTFYLLQMPRWNRRVRIAFDWTIALFFKNDVVELDVDDRPHPTAASTDGVGDALAHDHAERGAPDSSPTAPAIHV